MRSVDQSDIMKVLNSFQQGRWDRDKVIKMSRRNMTYPLLQFVSIETQNIHPAFLNQFTKQTPDSMLTYDVEYDIGLH